MSARRLALAVSAGLLVLVVAAAALIAASGKPARPLQPPVIPPAAAAPFPVPPAGSVVFARQDGSDVLALAVLPRARGLLLRASVVGQQGSGVRGLRVQLSAGAGGSTQTRAGAACGAGCYQATVPLRSPPRTLRVVVRRPSRTTIWNVAPPAAWPAPDATALVARATRVWTHLRSLSYVDRLRSDSVHAVVSRWRVVAPDRLAYRVEPGDDRTVIIGGRRWDRSGADAWSTSKALPVHQPQPFWVSVADAHVLGTGRIAARPLMRVSFFDPKTRGWFLASIDRRTGRTLDIRMWATAHFMHDTYGRFNAPLRIVPPA
ncbi:MAG TPA: hypothetical protein VFD90_12320 [Gaiellales bacterium]|jgi:hypothetical protein|nr:hypothetical protein [Gaiellales bacterium]